MPPSDPTTTDPTTPTPTATTPHTPRDVIRAFRAAGVAEQKAKDAAAAADKDYADKIEGTKEADVSLKAVVEKKKAISFKESDGSETVFEFDSAAPGGRRELRPVDSEEPLDDAVDTGSGGATDATGGTVASDASPVVETNAPAASSLFGQQG